MLVLHVINSLQKAAGTTVFCVELCDYLKLSGVEVQIAIPTQSFSQDLMLSQQDVPILRLNSIADIGFKPDIIHVHALWDRFPHQACTYARKHKIPPVISPHGMLTPWALKQKRLKKGLALALYQYRDLCSAVLLHATAPSEVEGIRRLGLRPPVFIAPLGVDMPAEKPPIRSNSPKIALFVSRIHPKKGLFNLVDAWALLKKRNVIREPWCLVIAGPDQDGHTTELKLKAEKLGLSVADIPATQLLRQPANLLLSQPAIQPFSPDIVFTGPSYGTEKDALYRMADLFVLPTYSENFGVVVIEALAHGCPVITTKGAPWSELLGRQACLAEWRHSGVADLENRQGVARAESPTQPIKPANPATPANRANPAIVSNGRCGWWIDIGAEPLAEALREAMRLSDEDRRAMGENGRKLVEEKYTWPAIAEQMKSAYEWIFSGGEAPGCVKV